MARLQTRLESWTRENRDRLLKCETCGSLDRIVLPLSDGELMCNRCFDVLVTRQLEGSVRL